MTAVNSVGSSTASPLTSAAEAVAAYMPGTPSNLVAVGGTHKATLSFTAPAGAVWYEAAILAAGDWQVPSTISLAPYAPCPLSQPINTCGVLQLDAGETEFDVPLLALAYRDGDYSFKVRVVDANGATSARQCQATGAQRLATSAWVSDAAGVCCLAMPDIPVHHSPTDY